MGSEEEGAAEDGSDEGLEEEAQGTEGSKEGVAEGAEEGAVEGAEEDGTEEEGAVDEDEVGAGVRMKLQSLFLLFFLSSSIAFFSKSEHVVSSTVDSLGMF